MRFGDGDEPDYESILESRAENRADHALQRAEDAYHAYLDRIGEGR